MRKTISLLLLALWAISLQAQVPAAQTLSGTWKATFADSAFSGTVYLTLEAKTDGTVTGSYKATTGGFGKVTGTVVGSVFTFFLTQTVEGCSGSYSGSLTLSEGRGAGTYSGSDCQGEHKNGVLSMAPATREEVAAVNSPEVIPAGAVYIQGRRYWVSKNDKYLVLLSAEQTGDYFILHVGVQNDSASLVSLDPSQIVVQDLLQPKPLHYFSPGEVASKARRRGSWAVFFRALAAGMQAYGQSQPTTSYSTGNFNVHDQYGNWVYGSYSGTTTTYKPPDTSQIQRQSAEDIAAIRQTTEARAASVEKSSAYAQTLAPRSYVLGYVYFSKAKAKNLKDLIGVNSKSFLVTVTLPLGENVFKFAFPLSVLEQVKAK